MTSGTSLLEQPLAGRRAVVTGAGSGIGQACAQLLAAHGAAVAALDVRGEAADQVASDLVAAGSRAVAACCDVSSEASVAAAVTTTAAHLGGLDLVVAAAGIARPARTHELGLDEWRNVIGVNLTGVFLTLKHSLPLLLEARGGTIVTIGSVASLVAAGRASSYDASKGGVLQLTRSIAAEYADRGIRANCVCPGLVATSLAENSRHLHGPAPSAAERPVSELIHRRPIDRAADPAEIAAVVGFLCSDASSFMTGAAVPVDGGHTLI